MSADRIFLDTNILIYLYTSTEPEKREKVAGVLPKKELVVSTQVLNELSNVLFRKFQEPWSAIRSVFREITTRCAIVSVSTDTIISAYTIAERYKYSYYDSLILASALEAECSLLYSEDFKSGQQIDNKLAIIDPLV